MVAKANFGGIIRAYNGYEYEGRNLFLFGQAMIEHVVNDSELASCCSRGFF